MTPFTPSMPSGPSTSRTASPTPRRFSSRMSFPGSPRTPAGARRFVDAVVEEWTGDTAEDAADRARREELRDTLALLVSELVTTAVRQPSAWLDVACSLQPVPGQDPPSSRDGDRGGEGSPLAVHVGVEVTSHRPPAVPGTPPSAWGASTPQIRDLGQRLMAGLAEEWGFNHRQETSTGWFRVRAGVAAAPGITDPPGVAAVPTGVLIESDGTLSPHPGPGDRPAESAPPGQEPPAGRAPTFLDELGELLVGQLDDDMVAALTGQLLVPRLADWCALWLAPERGAPMRLARVQHHDERRVAALRRELQETPPEPTAVTAARPWPWPAAADEPDPYRTEGPGGRALSFALVTGGRCVGTMVIGRRAGVGEETERTAQGVARRVAQAVDTARRYARQSAISRALQSKLLPAELARIPGVDAAIVYEAHGEGQSVGGDFYDLFPAGDDRWCFLIGDVQGKDTEAMALTGMTRHLVRTLAREGHGVAALLGKLNAALAAEAAETARSAAANGVPARPRFLSVLYGEMLVDPATGHAHCDVASAGHPLPLHLHADGSVVPATTPQLLLGIDEDARFAATPFDMEPGETLLCVTDGVTERRTGARQLDDDDGLAKVLGECAGLSAKATAEHVRRAAHDFDAFAPLDDDLAVMVLHTVPAGG